MAIIILNITNGFFQTSDYAIPMFSKIQVLKQRFHLFVFLLFSLFRIFNNGCQMSTRESQGDESHHTVMPAQ